MELGNRREQIIGDFLAMLESHARGMWRYRWQAVIAAWSLCILGWFTVLTMPPVYGANARVFVDTENSIRPLLRGIATSSDIINEVTIVVREMLSRPNLAEVARATDLDLRATTDQEFENLLASLQKRIDVSGNRDHIFSISFQDPDRDKALAVVESLVTTFVERSLVADRSDANNAQSFLQEQIEDYEARLTAAEDKLADFKRDNVEYMPGQRGGYFARLQAAQVALADTRTQLRLSEERRMELLRQIEGEEPVFGIMSTEADTEVSGFASAKIRELEGQLEELRLQYTDKHPRIGQILDTIELLKKQDQADRAAAAASGRSQQAGNPLDVNPVYQNMRIQLTNTEVEVASLRAQVRQQQQRVSELGNLVDTVPQVEAEFGRLNRDYDVVKTKYDQLVAQLETANIGEDAEQTMDKVQFRIIDPPFVGLLPAGPPRVLLTMTVLIAALGIAGAISFLLDLLNPVFFTSRAVTKIAGLPVLGSVGMLLSPEVTKKKRWSRLTISLAIGSLFATTAFLSLFSEQLSSTLRQITGFIV